MKSANTPHLQFCTPDGIGLSLANAAAHKRLNAWAGKRAAAPTKPLLTGEVVTDLIALGTNALVAHIGQLLAKTPVRIIVQSNAVTRIRVCGALDYVIDRAQQQVWAERAPLTQRELRATQQTPWHQTANDKHHNVDLLNPMCKPVWLNYVATRPGWPGYAFLRHKVAQGKLFIEMEEQQYVLEMIVQAAWRYLFRDKAFIALRHVLTSTLTLQLGASAVSLAMRSRLKTDQIALDARHMSLVLRHQRAFDTMARETPQLLPGLTAWLLHGKNDSAATALNVCDALPLMRADLLGADLQPRAWRYLVAHGFKRLQPHHAAYNPWLCMLQTLRALAASRWPALAPRGFLRLLHDTAGDPLHYEQTCDRSAAGWFWELACNEAAACEGDTAEYSYLCDLIPQWAWMVRHYQLKRDKNQRRKGREWLAFMSDAVESLTLKDTVPEWALWLPADGWRDDDVVHHKLKIVPLQCMGALRQEAFALHNCADAFEDRCRPESHVLLSLRVWATDKPVALVCVERRGCNWVLGQVAGPCNQPVRPWVRVLALQAAVWVRYHHALGSHQSERTLYFCADQQGRPAKTQPGKATAGCIECQDLRQTDAP